MLISWTGRRHAWQATSKQALSPDGGQNEGRDAEVRSVLDHETQFGARRRTDADWWRVLSARGVVVTGAGHGIGRAIARRLAEAGERVVVNDLDGDAADAVAAEIDGTAVPGDAATEAGVVALLATARQHLGRIDIYFANAGTDVGGGIDAAEDDWARSWEVNVLAHVRAARTLVPDWLEDGGGGRFVVTASAAGLLSMLGSAPYSVSKHAAVAFAEWLSATYRHRGVVVQALAPRTPTAGWAR